MGGAAVRETNEAKVVPVAADSAFAVIKVSGDGCLPQSRAIETDFSHVPGVRGVRVDRARRTIHVLCDGRLETLHRLGILVSAIGQDAWTQVWPAAVPWASRSAA